MKNAVLLISLTMLLAAFAQPLQAHSDKGGPILAASRNLVDPAIKIKALWDGRHSVDFHAADLPKMVSASQAHFLLDDEYVLGVTVNGESRAYPTRFLAWHHIVNDCAGKPESGGKAFITVTY